MFRTYLPRFDEKSPVAQAELEEAKQLAKQGQSLAKRVTVVCGGAKGLGPDIASRLVKEGAKVAIVDADAASAKGKVKAGRSSGERDAAALQTKNQNGRPWHGFFMIKTSAVLCSSISPGHTRGYHFLGSNSAM